MAEMSVEDYDWQPPSEAEMKIIQARRERSDKISKLMGDYLLKGYKMLGIVCQECSTILLQDKQGVNYCIACRELDTDTDKDDPVLNTVAARSQILEGSRADPSDMDDMSYLGRREKQPTTTQRTTSTSSATAAAIQPLAHQGTTTTDLPSSRVFSMSAVYDTNVSVNFTETVECLGQKIQWATEELKKSNSVEYSINLCQLIKSAADSIQSLKLAS